MAKLRVRPTPMVAPITPKKYGGAVTLISLLFTNLFLECVRGDVYMHNPRGSNDRNCERNVNRNNGNRLFDR